MIQITQNKLLRSYNGEKMQIEAWGKDSIRVRVTRSADFTDEDWALLPQEECRPKVRMISHEKENASFKVNAEERVLDDGAEFKNGKIKLVLIKQGKIHWSPFLRLRQEISRWLISAVHFRNELP